MWVNKLLQEFGTKLERLSQQKITSAGALNFAFPSLKSKEVCVSWKHFAALSLLMEPQSAQIYFTVSSRRKGKQQWTPKRPRWSKQNVTVHTDVISSQLLPLFIQKILNLCINIKFCMHLLSFVSWRYQSVPQRRIYSNNYGHSGLASRSF